MVKEIKCALSMLCLGVASLFSTAPYAAASEPIKIGFISTLTGPGSASGIDMYDGFMLAMDHEKANLGGVQIEVIEQDDQFKPEVGLQVARRLIQQERVQIITGIQYSNVMMAVHRPITEAGVFLVGSNAGPTPLTGKDCSPYFFSTSWNNDQLHENSGLLMNQLGFKRVYLLVPNYQAGRDAVEGFKRTFKGEVVGEVYTQLNQPDYSVEIANVALEEPDAIYTFYPGAMGINFTKQYSQAGFMGKIPMVSVATIDPTTLPALQETALGAIVNTSYVADIQNPANQQFVAAFREKYQREPSLYAAQSYDAGRLIASALRKTNGNVSDKGAFQAALQDADFESVRGYFEFNTNQFPISPFFRADVVKGENGKVVLSYKGVINEQSKDSYFAQCEMQKL